MCKDRYVIRMAGRIHRHLSTQPVMRAEWQSAALELLARLRTLEQNWNAARQASIRGWHAAAALKDREVAAEAARIEFAASTLVNVPMRPVIQSNPPSLRTIVEELQQLKQEFEDVEIDLKQGLIGVTTDRIVLEEIDLGPFSIELHVGRLAERQDGACFHCIALEPNPAASRDDTVHPHVQDGHLCAGDATLPIQAALKEGRISDAFILIKSVLETYNESSPYIALSDWSGTKCQDCDYLADSDGMYFCDGCDRDVCEDCYSICDMCDAGCCRSCLETDPVSGNRCCSACRSICGECNRTVDEESFDPETELCPECLEKHKQEQENEHGLETECVVGAANGTTANGTTDNNTTDNNTTDNSTTVIAPPIPAPAAA